MQRHRNAGLALAALGACLALVLALFALTRPSERELLHVSAPTGEHLILFEGERDFRSFPLSVERRHYVYIGRDSTPSGYGHRVSYDLHSELVDPALTADAYAKRITVTWSDAGVSIEQPSGHRLFVPKRAYSGGR